MEWIGAVAAGAEVQEPDSVLLGQLHETVPVKGVALRAREGRIDLAGAEVICDHFQRPRLRCQASFALFFRRKLGSPGLQLVQYVPGLVVPGQILEFGSRLFELRVR